jgi:cobalt/nickel transport system permease protein
MHMADALITPVVGGAMWAVTASLTVHCANKVKEDLDERKVPLMGVLGAFIFAAQMINFTIPATGSSGHLGGGMILAILLGPHAAFLVMASILAVQALFFADGGLLALGCNIFNLGFFPCLIAYPLIYKTVAGQRPTNSRIIAGATLASVISLQLGAFSVVLQTLASNISELPFSTFVLLMQPIHLAIGIIEGLVTAAVVTFVWKARPEVLQMAQERMTGDLSMKKVLACLVAVAVITGGFFSWFASSCPDGLEWAMFHTAGTEELAGPAGVAHAALAGIQEKTAFMPGYGFRETIPRHEQGSGAPEQWPAVSAGTTAAGMVGGFLTLVFAGLIGFFLRHLGRPAKP